MTSPTDITRRRREAKRVKGGKARKNKIRVNGTTPKLFKLDKPVVATKKI